MVDLAMAWFGNSLVTVTQIHELVNEAVAAADTIYGVEDALDWAEGFAFEQKGLDGKRDLDRLVNEFNGSLSTMARSVQDTVRQDRFNRNRWDGWPDDHWDDVSDRVKEPLSTLIDGMVIHVPDPPLFVPSGKPQRLRRKYLDVAPAVNKMVYELYEKGEVLIFPTDEIIELIPDLHFNITSWTTKSGKKKGRMLTNPSHGDDGVTQLNSEHIQEWLDSTWGKITHPTLKDIVKMILDMARRHGWDNIAMWTMDLANAFGLLFIHPESVRLLAHPLTNNLTMIYLFGMFGWMGTPSAFDVVSRALFHEVNGVIKGVMDIYVDDLIGVSVISEMSEDMRQTRAKCHQLLGPVALAADKEKQYISGEPGTQRASVGSAIGWDFDFNRKVVFMSRRNFMKTFYGFFSVDLNSQVNFNTMERLTSWASRYVQVARCMRPHVHGMYACMYSIRNKTRGKVSLSSSAKQDIIMWRMFLAAAWFHPDRFHRSMESFFPDPKDEVVVQFDGSLTGLGFVVWKDRQRLSPLYMVGIPVSYRFQHAYRSRWQNCMEFITVVLVVAFLAEQGGSGKSVHLVGDSEVVKFWIEKESFKGMFVRKAACAYVMITSQFAIEVTGMSHISSEDNHFADCLSRQKSTEEYCSQYGISPHPVETGSALLDLVQLIDPNTSLDNQAQFQTFWITLREILSSLSSTM
jgi:hypothetical protein